MSQKFQSSVQNKDDVSYVKLTGVIDEDNGLSELVDKIQGHTAVIHLGGIERINSCGVRDWVNWLGKVESKKSEIVLVECSPAIVAQINLVNNFAGNGAVKSFFVPYFCSKCEEEKVVLCEASEMAEPYEPPMCRCDECEQVMDFDDMVDSYFAFLATQKKVSKVDKLSVAAESFTHAEEDRSKVRSRISQVGNPNVAAPSLPTMPSLSSGNVRTSQPGVPFNPAAAMAPAGAGAESKAAGKNGMVYGVVGLLAVVVIVLAVILFK